MMSLSITSNKEFFMPVILIIFALWNTVLYGQEDTDSSLDEAPSAEEDMDGGSTLTEEPSPVASKKGSDSYCYFVGSTFPTLFSIGVEYWQFGVFINDQNRLVLDLGFSNEVRDDDGTEINGSQGDDTPPSLNRLDAEFKTRTLGLSYFRKLMKKYNVDVLGGLGIKFTNVQSRTQSISEDYYDDIEASRLVHIDSHTDSKLREILLLIDFEYALLQDLKIGYSFSLAHSSEEETVNNTSETIQEADGVPIGYSDPSITDETNKTQGIITIQSGIFIRYFF